MIKPFYLYQDIPGINLEVETQAGEPVSAASSTTSAFVMRFVPPDALAGIIASGGSEDPYSIRELTVRGGAINGAGSQTTGEQVYGEITSYVFTEGQVNRERETEMVESYTPLDFVQQYTTNFGPGNNFGYFRIRPNREDGGYAHRGVDIYVPQGSPVYAPFDVRVTATFGNQNGNGNGAGVVLESVEDPNLTLRYIHLQNYQVARGDIIPAGGQIGITIERNFDREGEGGSLSHLHLEANQSGGTRGNVNPYSVFDVSRTVFPSAQGRIGVKVNPDASLASQFGFYAEATANLATSSYRNPDNAALQTILPLNPSRLQEYVYQGQRASATTPDRAAIIDRAYKSDIALQLRILALTPPIVMMINPNSLSTSQSKLSQYQAKARGGYIYEEFRGDIWTLQMEFSTGGFYVKPGPRRGAGDTSPASPEGLQMTARRDSAAYQQFIAVLALYQNNGSVIDRVTGSKSRPLVGAIAIEWDGWVYIGKFTSFSYTEDEANVHRMTFSMTFEATQRFAYDDATRKPTPFADPNTGDSKDSPSQGLNFWDSLGIQFTQKENGPIAGNPRSVASFTPNILQGPVADNGFETIDPVPNLFPFRR